jgi:hypothetical protein
MATTNVYDIDSTVLLTANFTNAAGAAADPTSVTLLVLNPAGVETTYTLASGQVTKTAVGAYQMALVANASGVWTYKWQGAGVVNQTSPDTKFIVRPSALITG